MEGVEFLVYVLAFILALAVLFAQLRLFSIDRTLKAILSELQGRPREGAVSAAPGPVPGVLDSGTRAIVVILAGMFVLLVLFLLSARGAAAQAVPGPTAPVPPARTKPQDLQASTEWKFEQTESELDGRVSQLLYAQGSKLISVWTGEEVPVLLALDCERQVGQPRSPVTVALVLKLGFHGGATGFSRYWTRIRFRFRRSDGSLTAIRAEDWLIYDKWASPHLEADGVDPGKFYDGVSPNAAAFLAALLENDLLIVEFTPRDAGTQTATFDLRGLTTARHQVTACTVP